MEPQAQTKRFSKLNRYSALLGALLVLGGCLLLRTDFVIAGRGTVEYARKNDFFAPADGWVATLQARTGEEVRAGDVLLRLRSPTLEAEELQARRALAALKADRIRVSARLDDLRHRPVPIEFMDAPAQERLLEEMESAQDTLIGRLESLVDSGGVSKIGLAERRIERLRVRAEALAAKSMADWMRAGLPEWERSLALAEKEAVEVEYVAARERAERIEERANALTIRAPFDGIVADLAPQQVDEPVKEGQYLLRVADPESAHRIEAYVPQRNADLLKPGQPVRMESRVFASVFEGPVRGELVSVSPMAAPPSLASDPKLGPAAGDIPLDLDIRVSDSPHPLIAGTTLEIEVVVGRRSVLEMFLPHNRAQLRSTVEPAASSNH